MPTATVSAGNPFRRDVPAAAADPTPPPAFTPTQGATANTGLAVLNYGLGTRNQIEDELDRIAEAVRGFFMLQPDEVMRYCMAYTARLSELAVLLHRAESYDKQFWRIRTMQVQVYLDELDRQFKTASRIVEVLRQDLEMSR